MLRVPGCRCSSPPPPCPLALVRARPALASSASSGAPGGGGGGGGGGQLTWSTRSPATASTPGRRLAGRSDSSTAVCRSSAACAAWQMSPASRSDAMRSLSLASRSAVAARRPAGAAVVVVLASGPACAQYEGRQAEQHRRPRSLPDSRSTSLVNLLTVSHYPGHAPENRGSFAPGAADSGGSRGRSSTARTARRPSRACCGSGAGGGSGRRARRRDGSPLRRIRRPCGRLFLLSGCLRLLRERLLLGDDLRVDRDARRASSGPKRARLRRIADVLAAALRPLERLGEADHAARGARSCARPARAPHRPAGASPRAARARPPSARSPRGCCVPSRGAGPPPCEPSRSAS